MKLIFYLIIVLFLSSCGKPKTVLICGDHVCINKNEAEQFFEENLTIEVKIIDAKKKDDVDLVQLNLEKNLNGNNKVSILSKKNTNEKIKILSDKEVNKIRKDLKIKKKNKKIAKKNVNKDRAQKQYEIKNIQKKNSFKSKDNQIIKKNVLKKHENVIDVCSIIDKCSIDEISKYLLEQSKNNKYPDITTRQ